MFKKKLILLSTKTVDIKKVWSGLSNFIEQEMKLLEEDEKKNNGNQTSLKKRTLASWKITTKV